MKPHPNATIPTTMNGRNRTSVSLIQMTTRVGIGSSAPRPANMAAKVGITFHKMTVTTAPAITSTAMG